MSVVGLPGAAQLFELPYPSDLRVKSDGALDLGHLGTFVRDGTPTPVR
jgi:hypothetical protein